jgi:hypothetical protein
MNFEVFAISLAITFTALMFGAGVLHLIPKLGAAGQRLSDFLCGGLPLDLVVTWFTALPLILGPILGGWAGLLGAVLGQLLMLIGWTLIHEAVHRKTKGRAKILRATNQIAGVGPNLFCVFWTAWATPIFWLTRVAEYFVYAPLIWFLKFPRYNHREWVNVSRHKFEGLVGHDRIWCLYCDWMTGVWSLGTEMLRNVESFWCPVRFNDAAKCDNCSIDFPDVNDGWVPFEANAEAAADRLLEKYGEQGEVRPRAWFGHPSREPTQVTVKETDESST